MESILSIQHGSLHKSKIMPIYIRYNLTRLCRNTYPCKLSCISARKRVPAGLSRGGWEVSEGREGEMDARLSANLSPSLPSECCPHRAPPERLREYNPL